MVMMIDFTRSCGGSVHVRELLSYNRKQEMRVHESPSPALCDKMD